MTTEQVAVTTAPGVRVRCPDGSVLPEGGGLVTWSPFWERRLQDGDITLTPAAPAKRAAPAAGADHAG